VLPKLVGVADELVIGIDESTTDNTEKVAREFTSRIFTVPHAAYLGAGQSGHVGAVEWMLPHCKGDWVLRIDHDETLSPHWHDRDYVDELLSDRYATHVWIPRRWVLPPGDRYISSRHWQPDYQLRLFRNIPSLIRFNKKAHEPPVIVGEARSLADCWIEHWDYLWHDRTVREQKVQFYSSLNVYTGADYYLYENQRYETRELSYIAAPVILKDLPKENGTFNAAVRVVDRPEVFCAGTLEPVLLLITNTSSRVFWPADGWSSRENAFVSYHWFHEDGRLLQWDYPRSGLPRRIPPKTSALIFLRVQAPTEPGRYVLEPDLVEEGVAWVSYHCPMDSCEVVVERP
jgi:hypothetical protein